MTADDPRLRQLLRAVATDRDVVVPNGMPGLPAALRRHGLSGLAATAIDRGRVSVSPEVSARIRADWASVRRWAAILDLECERIGQAVDRARASGAALSVPILLKGRTVARRYADPTVRGYADIDLMIPLDDAPRWGPLLEGLSFPALGPWHLRELSLGHDHQIVYRRPVGTGSIACELHPWLMLEARARRLDYGALVLHTEESVFAGMLEPSDAALLLVLGVHLASHSAESRKLIWLRDFIEIGSLDTVEEARKLATDVGVSWALELALWRTERLLERSEWGTERPRDPGFTLAGLSDFERSGLLYHLALVRELGPRRGARYIAGRLDPRRFRRPRTGYDWQEARRWLGRQMEDLRSGAWARRMFGRR